MAAPGQGGSMFVKLHRTPLFFGIKKCPYSSQKQPWCQNLNPLRKNGDFCSLTRAYTQLYRHIENEFFQLVMQFITVFRRSIYHKACIPGWNRTYGNPFAWVTSVLGLESCTSLRGCSLTSSMHTDQLRS